MAVPVVLPEGKTYEDVNGGWERVLLAARNRDCYGTLAVPVEHDQAFDFMTTNYPTVLLCN